MTTLRDKAIDRIERMLALEAQNADLLAALKTILTGFENGDFKRTRPRQSDSDPYHPALLAARAAIQQAEATR